MNFVVQKDLKKSVGAFEKFTVHAIKAHFGGVKLIHSYENSNDLVERELDLKFGIDGVIVDGEDYHHFYASRVQFGKPYNTFTIRTRRPSGAKTEIDKIGQSVDEPQPEYHIHTYVDFDGRGAVVGIAETTEVKQAVYRYKLKPKTNHSDGVEFVAVNFDKVEGVRVFYVDDGGNVRDVTAKIKAAAA